MQAKELTGLLATIAYCERIYSSVTRCADQLSKIAEDDIVISLERDEDYHVHRVAIKAKKITESLAFFMERKKAVDDAFSAALMYLQAEVQEAQGTPGLDFSGNENESAPAEFL